MTPARTHRNGLENEVVFARVVFGLYDCIHSFFSAAFKECNVFDGCMHDDGHGRVAIFCGALVNCCDGCFCLGAEPEI
jgi:hypothetical protein